jgi:PKD repeat protein
LLAVSLSFLLFACGGTEGIEPDLAPVAQPVSVSVGDMVIDIDFNGSSPRGPVPLTVYFDGTRSRSTDPNNWIAAFEWDFGDVTAPSSAGWVAHTYTRPGRYTASLTVTEGHGQVGTARVTIDVLNDGRPIVWFSGPDQYRNAKPVRYFDATLSKPSDPNDWISRYHWDFGDGTQSNAGWVAHTYQNPGVYRATLTTFDNRGAARSTSVNVDVPCAAVSGCGQMPLTPRGGSEPLGGVVYPGGIHSDGQGNWIVVVNNIQSGAPEGELRIFKLAPSGGLQWLVSKPGVSSPFASAITPSGQIWVALSNNGQNSLLNLSPTGAERRKVPLPPGGVAAIAADVSENVYASLGSTLNKYSDGGTLLWSRSYSWFMNAVASVGKGIWVGGLEFGAGRPFLGRLNGDGTVAQSKVLSASRGQVREIAANSKVVALIGEAQGSPTWKGVPSGRGAGPFLLVAEPDGAERWGQLPQREQVGGLEVDTNGVIWLSASLPRWVEVVGHSPSGALRTAKFFTVAPGVTAPFPIGANSNSIAVGREGTLSVFSR